MLVRDYLAAQARTWPERIAYVAGDVRHSWARTQARVARLAAAFTALGVGKGDTGSAWFRVSGDPVLAGHAASRAVA